MPKTNIFDRRKTTFSYYHLHYQEFLNQYTPDQVICPFCGAFHSCKSHDIYERYLVDFNSGKTITRIIQVPRVICTSCGHTHAILPDMIIPYKSYGVLFILRVISEYMMHRNSVAVLCKRFDISHSMLYRWYLLYLEHMDIWLKLLFVMDNSIQSPYDFLKYLYNIDSFSQFLNQFMQYVTISFLQSHCNSDLYKQAVF